MSTARFGVDMWYCYISLRLTDLCAHSIIGFAVTKDDELTVAHYLFSIRYCRRDVVYCRWSLTLTLNIKLLPVWVVFVCFYGIVWYIDRDLAIDIEERLGLDSRRSSSFDVNLFEFCTERKSIVANLLDLLGSTISSRYVQP